MGFNHNSERGAKIFEQLHSYVLHELRVAARGENPKLDGEGG